MIDVLSLTKRFATTLAVDQVTFSCEQGEILGLLGPNGAGKTTTLRMLATALRPTSGTARISGFDITTQPEEVRRQVGVLPSEPGLYGRLTPREILRYFGQLYDMTPGAIESRTRELLSLLGLDEHADQRTETFSRGMRQKVSIARTLIHDPPVIFLDEPTAGLDVMSARAIHDFIVQCKAAGKSIILSTHMMAEAEKLCDRIAIINHGRIVAIGTMQELRNAAAGPASRDQGSDQVSLEEVFVKLAGKDDFRVDPHAAMRHHRE
ncbi:MAG TPA: ABC transporter ATP-binding protein [Firmicutes bacterium]|nr:ABC transporter ATP-binding protein [Bacillota bacterium]